VKLHKILVLLFILISGIGTAQISNLCKVSDSKKAIKKLEDAKDAKKSKKDYKVIKELCEEAAEEDTSFAEPWLVLGDVAFQKKDYPTMKKAYARLIEICPDADAKVYYRMGTYLYDTKKYTDATNYLKSYLEFATTDEAKNKEVEVLLFRAKMIANPVPFNPELVKGVSSADPEYLAIISPDHELCFYTRRFDEVSKGSITPKSVEKFMISKKSEQTDFDKGQVMPPPFNMNTSNNEGGASISKDNRFLFFTRNDNGNFDLYYSEFIKDKWGDITNMGPNVNDPKQWDSQPSISPDGKTLLFATYRDTVNFTSDIYKTVKQNGTWGKATPLSINTNGNEKSPFIHPDNKTLYFSSDSLPGMGGFDIYLCRKNDKGEWGKPINLGYPINTESDEVGFFVSTDGRKGYFASNKLSGAGGYDIYSFELPEDKRPEKVLFVKGQVRGDNDQIPLAAKIEMKNLTTSETIEVDYDSLTGNYASVVSFDADYIMTIKKEGHAYNSQYFGQEDSAINGVVTSDLELRKIAVGSAYKLNNIRFATNSSELNKASKNIITDFAGFLKENPRVNVAIHGHTDSAGDAAANMTLSNDRAKSVYDFLIKSGINASRLSFKGFGQTKPVVSNDTEEGRSKNRRTEFVIMNN
jgi:outer membrane protein OmpA-like peptidoglycan-associated protein/Tol biopolymer transport system component